MSKIFLFKFYKSWPAIFWQNNWKSNMFVDFKRCQAECTKMCTAISVLICKNLQLTKWIAKNVNSNWVTVWAVLKMVSHCLMDCTDETLIWLQTADIMNTSHFHTKSTLVSFHILKRISQINEH